MPTVSPIRAREEIVALLSDAVYQALGLKASLEDERSALETEDMAAIDHAVGAKTLCVQQLQLLDQKREALCNDWGFESGPEQMQSVIDYCDDDDLIKNRWDHLMLIAAGPMQ